MSRTFVELCCCTAGDTCTPALWHTVDALAALSAATRTQEGSLLISHYADGADGEHDAPSRVAAAAAAIRFSEVDAIHLPSCVTPAAIAIPVALALAPNAERFARSVEAGFRAGIIIADALGGADALNHGVWPTLAAAPAVAAMTTAVALELGEEAASRALSLALCNHAGRRVLEEERPSLRWTAIGDAAYRGMRAALGPPQRKQVERDFSVAEWLAGQTPLAKKPSLPAGLESQPAMRRTGFKPFACSRQSANAIVAFCELVEQGLNCEQITAIEVDLHPVALSVAARPFNSSSRLSRIANLPFQLGLAAHEKDWAFDLDRGTLATPRVLALAERVAVSPDALLDDGRSGSWPARVTVHLNDRTVSRTCSAIPGDFGDPDPSILIEKKVSRLCSMNNATQLTRALKEVTLSESALQICRVIYEAEMDKVWERS